MKELWQHFCPEIAPIVRRVDNAIPSLSAIQRMKRWFIQYLSKWLAIYPMDSAIQR